MINQQLLDYIKQRLQKGVSKEQVKSSLVNNGWDVSDVEEGFNAVSLQFPPPIPHAPSPAPTINPIIQPASNIINPVVSLNSQLVQPPAPDFKKTSLGNLILFWVTAVLVLGYLLYSFLSAPPDPRYLLRGLGFIAYMPFFIILFPLALWLFHIPMKSKRTGYGNMNSKKPWAWWKIALYILGSLIIFITILALLPS